MIHREYPFYDVDLSFRTVRDVVDVIHDTYQDNPVLRYKEGDRVVSVDKETFTERIQQIGRSLHEAFPRGTHVALLGKTSYPWIAAFFGIMNAENVTVPLDKELPAKDILEQVEFADCQCLMYDREFEATADLVREKLSDIVLICFDDVAGRTSLSQFVEQHPGQEGWVGDPSEQDVAEIVFTSGTTGKSKGVMLTHQNLAHNAMNGKSFVKLSPEDQALSILPINHTLEIAAGIMTPFCSGVTININEGLRQFTSNLQFYKPHVMIVVPMVVENIHRTIWRTIERKKMTRKVTLAMRLARALRTFRIDLRRRLFSKILQNLGGNLKVLVVGGAFMKPEIIKDFEDWGISMVEGYGVSECGPVISCNTDRYKREGSVGKVVTGCEAKTVDDEIWVQGPIVMKGYYKDPEGTKEVFDGPWYRTGDLGRIDKDQYIYLTGRKKNLIILSNGKNVSPEELEQHLLDLDYVREALVFGEDNAIHAEVYLDRENVPDAEAQLREAIERINQAQPGYKRIAQVHIRDTEFEKTTTKKVKRFKA